MGALQVAGKVAMAVAGVTAAMAASDQRKYRRLEAQGRLLSQQPRYGKGNVESSTEPTTVDYEEPLRSSQPTPRSSQTARPTAPRSNPTRNYNAAPNGPDYNGGLLPGNATPYGGKWF
jgi:cell division septation protein DedD